MSRYRAYSETCDRILLSIRSLFPESCCLVSVGRPLWREVGSVVCISQSSNLPSSIYVTYVLEFSNLYTIYTKLHSVPSEYSRLCSTSCYYYCFHSKFWEFASCCVCEIKVRVFSVCATLISQVFYYLFYCATCYGPRTIFERTYFP
jgi:hypothetical protein